MTSVDVGPRPAVTRHVRRVILLAAALIALLTGFAGTARASSVINVSVPDPTPSAAAGARAVYTVGFTTSANGPLCGAGCGGVPGKIVLGFPTDTNLGTLVSSSVDDTSTAQQVGVCAQSGSTVTCTINGNSIVRGGDVVSVTLNGVTSSPAGSYALSVVTSSDTTPVTSPSYSVVAASQVSQPAVTVSDGAPGAAAVTYSVAFTASATGGLSAPPNSQVSLVFPGGTNLATVVTSSVTDTTTGLGVGTCSESGVIARCDISSGAVVSAGDAVVVTLGGVTNPPSGSYTIGVSTTSDTVAVSSAVYVVGAPPVPPPVLPPVPPPVLPPVMQPISRTGAPRVIGSSSAVFSATINPQGRPTTVHFEYSGAAFAVGAAAVLYDARTPEQPVGSDFSDHAVTATVAGLVPNSMYHVRAVASNPSGVTPGSDTTFRTAIDPPPPPPVLAKSFNAVPVSGTVYVLLPGAGHVAQAHASAAKGVGFVPLTEARQLPVGTIFDTTGGVARLTSATATKGKLQSGDFAAGLFRVLQNRRQRGLTELGLVRQASAGKTCGRAGKAQTAARRALPKTVVALLRADVKGKFRTRGRYSSATVRGTSWTTTDRCDGTLTTVKRGTVVVSDFRRKRQIVLHAGRSYLAKAP